MHKKTQNAADLRLCVDPTGVIWFTTEQAYGKAHMSELGAEEWVDKFLTTANLGDIARIRIFGFQTSAPLICALQDAIRAPNLPPYTVQIGSPAHVPAEAKKDPRKLFAAMDDLVLPTSCGGWHDMTTHDYSCYNLIKFMTRQKKLPDDFDVAVQSYLAAHPAYPAISFIPSHSPMMSAMMLSAIIDPRWFVDPLKPDRTSRLRSYMGMQIESVERAIKGCDLNDRAQRAQWVFGSYTFGDLTSGSPTAPGNFLLRLIDTTKGAKGTLKASVRYLSFVRNVWLNSIAPKGRCLFVPEYFFEDEFEAAAYRKHVEQLGVKG